MDLSSLIFVPDYSCECLFFYSVSLTSAQKQLKESLQWILSESLNVILHCADRHTSTVNCTGPSPVVSAEGWTSSAVVNGPLQNCVSLRFNSITGRVWRILTDGHTPNLLLRKGRGCACWGISVLSSAWWEWFIA